MKFPIQLLGERHSGTNYLRVLLELNLNNIAITQDFGGKHWYLRDHFPRCAPNNSTDHECNRSLDDAEDTLFLIILRNPYDWLRAMALEPYHAPEHRGLGFHDFIRKPWTSFEHVRVNPLWPANVDNTYLIETADNILQLRTTKLRHWLNLRDRVNHIGFINYESLRDNVDTLGELAASLGLPLRGDRIIDEPRYCAAGAIHDYAFHPRHRSPIHPEDLEFINNQLDWGLEQSMGYVTGDYTHDD